MGTSDRLDVAVVGGGVVGLAIARALALSGREVCVLEAESALGTHTSSRNSEVIHAGLYYPSGSERARLCTHGNRLLYDFCEQHGVAHARLGKLVVATRDDELPALERVAALAEANGVRDLAWLDAGDVRALEPDIASVRALLSPSTGIVDSHALLAALKRDALAHGAQVVTSTPVRAGRVEPEGFALELGGIEPATARFRAVVNAAGLRAPSVTRSIAGVDLSVVPREYFAKGHYFVLAHRSSFRRLVYPVPGRDGLGIHLTLDLAGQTRFGPDVSFVDGVDYAFDERRAPSFYSAIRSYYPGLADGSLVPGYTGIRPKLGPAGSVHDFSIHGPSTTGAAGFVALYGIDSPGLTAALAIAERVRDLLA